MITQIDSLAMKEAIEIIEGMIEDYEKPMPKDPDHHLSNIIMDHSRGLVALGLRLALDVLKKRVI